MDLFKPLSDRDVAKLSSVLNELHSAFVEHVKGSRGQRLTASDEELFNGDFWSGQTAVNLGNSDSNRSYVCQVLCHKSFRD